MKAPEAVAKAAGRMEVGRMRKMVERKGGKSRRGEHTCAPSFIFPNILS